MRQTLDQVLLEGDNPASSQLYGYFTKEAARADARHFCIRASFKPHGESYKVFFSKNLPKDKAVPEAVGPICDAIKTGLTSRWGEAAFGKLKLHVYRQGRSAHVHVEGVALELHVGPDVEEMNNGGGNDSTANFLASLLLSKEANFVALSQVVAAQSAQIAAIAQSAQAGQAELAGHMATLSTARTMGSAASDLGGLWQVGGLLALALGWPIIKEVAGDIGQTLPFMIKATQEQLKLSVRGAKRAALVGDAATQQVLGDLPPPVPPGLLPLYDDEDDATGPHGQSERAPWLVGDDEDDEDDDEGDPAKGWGDPDGYMTPDDAEDGMTQDEVEYARELGRDLVRELPALNPMQAVMALATRVRNEPVLERYLRTVSIEGAILDCGGTPELVEQVLATAGPLLPADFPQRTEDL